MFALALLALQAPMSSLETVETICHRLLDSTKVRYSVPTEVRHVLISTSKVPAPELAGALACGLMARWEKTPGGRRLVLDKRQALQDQYLLGLGFLDAGLAPKAPYSVLRKVDVAPLSTLQRERYVPLGLAKLTTSDQLALRAWVTEDRVPNAERTVLVGALGASGISIRAITTVIGERHVEKRLVVPLSTGLPPSKALDAPFRVAWGSSFSDDPYGGLAGAIEAASRAQPGISPLSRFLNEISPTPVVASPPYLCVWTPDILELCRIPGLHPLARALASTDALFAYEKVMNGLVTVLRPRSLYFARSLPDWQTIEQRAASVRRRFSFEDASSMVASTLQSQGWDGYDAIYSAWVSGKTHRRYWHQRDEPWAFAFWGCLTSQQKEEMLRSSLGVAALTPEQLWLFERSSSWSTSSVASQFFDVTDAIIEYGTELRLAARLMDVVRYTAEESKYLKVFGDDMPMRLLGIYLRQARNAHPALPRADLLKDVVVTRTTFPGLVISLFRNEDLLHSIELKRDLDGLETRGVRLSELGRQEAAEVNRLLDQVFPPLPGERP